MSRKSILIVTAVAVLAMLLLACGSDGSSPPPPPPPPPPPSSTVAICPEGSICVNLEDPGGSGKYQFDAKDFKFKVGEKVDFVFTSETELHTFTVDDLEIDVSVDATKTVPFTFTFEKAGTYKLNCIPHGSLGMEGTITVE